MRDDWKPLLHAACVAADDRFALAYGEFEFDDPFFILIDYDGSAPQPWARRDVKREISTVIPIGAPSFPSSKYAALSREGDIYFIADQTAHERIEGAGLASPDSLQLGEMFDLTLINEELWAVGGHGQFYRRATTGWRSLGLKYFEALDLQKANIGHVTGAGENDIYLSYTLPPDEAVLPAPVREELAKSESWDDWNNAYARAEADRARKSPTRGLLQWNGSNFNRIALPLPADETIDALYVDTDSEVYVAGGAGVIAKGNARDGFKSLSFLSTKERILSLVRFGNSIYYLTNKRVAKLDEGRIKSINFPFPNARPLKLATSCNFLFYFDRRARIALFDGERWSEIKLPPSLVQRKFGGL